MLLAALAAALTLAAEPCNPALNSLDIARMSLSWDPAPGAAYYELWVRDSFGGLWQLAAQLPCPTITQEDEEGQPFTYTLCVAVVTGPGDEAPVKAPVLRYVDRPSGFWYDLAPIAVAEDGTRSLFPGLGTPETYWPAPNSTLVKLCWPTVYSPP